MSQSHAGMTVSNAHNPQSLNQHDEGLEKSAGGGKKTLNTNFVLVAKIHASSQVDAPKAYRARCGQRKQHDEALGKSAGGEK